VASSEEVNLSSAQSAILSTNFGQATSDLAKFQVLSQTGISALAQANSSQQEILKLLQSGDERDGGRAKRRGHRSLLWQCLAASNLLNLDLARHLLLDRANKNGKMTWVLLD